MESFAWLGRPIYLVLLVFSLIVGCGGDGDRPESLASPNNNGRPQLDSVFMYDHSASNSEKILQCSKLFLSFDSCDIADVKPIGVDVTGNVSIDNIKERLVVSHDWMADSFIDALNEINSQEFLNFFKPLNAIVLSYDIRPAFYQVTTASVYIDARYLWRNGEEWETIYQQDDFRDSYVSEFMFESFQRYVNANSNSYTLWSNAYNAESYNRRTSAQIAPGLFRLLTHELAHANDYLPPEVLANLGNKGKIYNDYIYPASHIYDQLSSTFPLRSDLLNEAAQIAYLGADMTDRIRTTSAGDIGRAFDSDGAADFYGYSTAREDVAMLFEAFMMYKKYGAVSDTAFTTIPTTEGYGCDDYVIKWGQRNRLADLNVKQRAILISSRILARDVTPDFSFIAFAPIDMEADTGWCASRYGTTAASVQASRDGFHAKTSQRVVHDYRDDMVRSPHHYLSPFATSTIKRRIH